MHVGGAEGAAEGTRVHELGAGVGAVDEQQRQEPVVGADPATVLVA